MECCEEDEAEEGRGTGCERESGCGGVESLLAELVLKEEEENGVEPKRSQRMLLKEAGSAAAGS